MATTQGIKLDDDTRNRLKNLGKIRDRSPHYLMKKAVEEYLVREERYEREKAEDLAAWEHYKRTGEAIPNEKVVAWLEQLAQGKDVSWRN